MCVKTPADDFLDGSEVEENALNRHQRFGNDGVVGSKRCLPGKDFLDPSGSEQSRSLVPLFGRGWENETPQGEGGAVVRGMRLLGKVSCHQNEGTAEF